MRSAVTAGVLALATYLGRFLHFHDVAIFFLAGCSLLVLGDLLARAQEEVSGHLGPLAGGLINATFGNSIELTVGILALSAGQIEVVKGTVVGSIVTNLLLILGLSALAGGLKYKYQTFQPRVAAVMISTMTVAVIALLMPAVVPSLPDTKLHPRAIHFSLGVSVVLIVMYVLGLVFSLVTHREVSATRSGRMVIPAIPKWSLRKGVGVLLSLTLVVVSLSDALVDSLEGMMKTLPLSPSFLGVIVLAGFGNAADLSGAVRLARKNRIDMVYQLVSGAATQVALLVGPIFVLVGYLIGQPMTLQFTPLQVVSVAVATLIVGVSSGDGEFDWYKGMQLLGVYGILAVANFFY